MCLVHSGIQQYVYTQSSIKENEKRREGGKVTAIAFLQYKCLFIKLFWTNYDSITTQPEPTPFFQLARCRSAAAARASQK